LEEAELGDDGWNSAAADSSRGLALEAAAADAVVERMFSALDANGDGVITSDELRKALTSGEFEEELGSLVVAAAPAAEELRFSSPPPQAEPEVAAAAVAAAPPRSSGRAAAPAEERTEEEPVSSSPTPAAAATAEVERMFSVLDADGDGVVTSDELRKALTSGEFGESGTEQTVDELRAQLRAQLEHSSSAPPAADDEPAPSSSIHSSRSGSPTTRAVMMARHASPPRQAVARSPMRISPTVRRRRTDADQRRRKLVYSPGGPAVQRGETPPTAEGYRSPRERNRVKLVEAMEYAEFDGRQQHWRTRKQRLEEEGRSPQVRQTQLSFHVHIPGINDQFTMTGLCWDKHREYSQKKMVFGRAGLA
jgi:tellurite resistance protein